MFDRFDGLAFEDNVRNFLRMVVNGESGNTASRISSHAAIWQDDPKGTARLVPVVLTAPIETESTPQPFEPAHQLTLHPALQFAHIEVADEEESIEILATEIDDTDEPSETDRLSATVWASRRCFMSNRTREQDQVIALAHRRDVRRRRGWLRQDIGGAGTDQDAL